jgi:ABC-type Fe3+-hydroxamate transport system substrate-binding protein
LTELVCDLGSATELVGVTKFCEHAAAASIEKVGGTKDPDVSRVVALAPDLVLMNREENRLEDADSLAAAGVHVHSTMPVNLPETLDCIRSLGRELGKAQACELLTTGIEKAWHEVKQRAGRRGPMRYAYLIWRKPWMGAGTPSYIDALLAAAGVENVLAAADARYPVTTPAELAELSPEVVLLSSEPFPFRERHRQELGALTKLPESRFRLVDGKRLSWHGSHTLSGLAYADELFDAVSRGTSGWRSPAGGSNHQ